MNKFAFVLIAVVVGLPFSAHVHAEEKVEKTQKIYVLATSDTVFVDTAGTGVQVVSAQKVIAQNTPVVVTYCNSKYPRGAAGSGLSKSCIEQQCTSSKALFDTDFCQSFVEESDHKVQLLKLYELGVESEKVKLEIKNLDRLSRMQTK